MEKDSTRLESRLIGVGCRVGHTDFQLDPSAYRSGCFSDVDLARIGGILGAVLACTVAGRDA